jgi:hypothetical protein
VVRFGDDPRRNTRVSFTGPLDAGFDLSLLHGFAELPVDVEAAAAIEHAAPEVNGDSDVEIADFDVPVLVPLEGLHESGAFLGRYARVRPQDAGLLEDAINAGWAASDDVPIEEYEGKSAITFERELGVKVEDGFLLVGFEPFIARDTDVALVDLPYCCFQSWNLLLAMSNQARKRLIGISTLSGQAHEKSMTWSWVSWRVQPPVTLRDPCGTPREHAMKPMTIPRLAKSQRCDFFGQDR